MPGIPIPFLHRRKVVIFAAVQAVAASGYGDGGGAAVSTYAIAPHTGPGGKMGGRTGKVTARHPAEIFAIAASGVGGCPMPWVTSTQVDTDEEELLLLVGAL